MAEPAQHPLLFSCFKCRRKSTYPNYLQEGEDQDSIKEVVKRCQHCGIPNKVQIPDGWSAGKPDSLLRGLAVEEL